ncbi:hypothetical protein P8C59_006503 [Phyllachora maydis]|uniref:Ubiquitin-like protease family profile domain-containing protein n=1 Tax=Phyllachora maydis TaxID=1825666 RepID=A0AAD9I6V8_9PEZI|nr:hypothetical protein P8C59_006503 [Phyllachora maydis]
MCSPTSNTTSSRQKQRGTTSIGEHVAQLHLPLRLPLRLPLLLPRQFKLPMTVYFVRPAIAYLMLITPDYVIPDEEFYTAQWVFIVLNNTPVQYPTADKELAGDEDIPGDKDVDADEDVDADYGNHWSLLVVNRCNKRAMHFDSKLLVQPNLKLEDMTAQGRSLLQTNHKDCGVIVCVLLHTLVSQLAGMNKGDKRGGKQQMRNLLRQLGEKQVRSGKWRLQLKAMMQKAADDALASEG